MFFNPLLSLSPWRASLWLITLFSVIKLLVGAGAGLSVDEAHYALYGLYPDWSYFDHPPLIGWLQALVLMVSDSTLALRVLPVLMFAASGVLMYRVALTLFPQRSPWLGFVSVALLQSGLMFQLIGMAMLPDTPLLLLGLLLLLVLHRIVTAGRVQDWLLLGLLMGLSALSKYTAITLVLTVISALAFSGQWRQLRTPGPWLATLLAAVLLIPILYWNMQHDWISFRYQLQHGTGDMHWQLKQFVRSELAQMLAYGFAVVVLALMALPQAWRERQDTGVMLCLALGLPVLLLFGWNAGYVMTLPHWAALGWAALLPLAAHTLIRLWHRRGMRFLVYVSAGYSLLLMLVLFAEMLSPRLPFDTDRHPMRDLYGWQEAATQAARLHAEMAQQPGVAPQLFVSNWTHASRLAWYARPLSVIPLDQRYDQFDLWYGEVQQGSRGILVIPGEDTVPATGGQRQFARCEARDKLPIMSKGHVISTFSFFACDDYRH